MNGLTTGPETSGSERSGLWSKRLFFSIVGGIAACAAWYGLKAVMRKKEKALSRRGALHPVFFLKLKRIVSIFD